MWILDAIASLVVVFFFFAGIADGTVGGSNIGLWLVILAAIGLILGGSIWLRMHEHPALAAVLLLVILLPALCFLAFILLTISGNLKWN